MGWSLVGVSWGDLGLLQQALNGCMNVSTCVHEDLQIGLKISKTHGLQMLQFLLVEAFNEGG